MKLSKSLIVASLATILAACGGGGSSTSTSPAPASSTSASVVLFSPTPATTAPTATGDPATDAFNWTNYRRAQVGLAAFKRNAALDKAAGAHMNYVTLNNSYNTEGHSETTGKPGFTGVTPAQRIAVAGYSDPFNSENMSASNGLAGRQLTDSLVDAPYHRQTQLGPYTDAGAAAGLSSDGTQLQYVLDVGTRNVNVGPTNRQLVVYPFNSQTGVFADWLANEVPNPVPDLAGQRVGYPVSIGSPLAATLTVSTFTVSDAKGVPVNARLITTRTDTNGSLGAYAFVVPLAPLNQGATYTAHAVGTLDGQAFDVTWTFTTIPATTLTVSANAGSIAATAGSQVTLYASGGTGNIVGIGIGQGSSAGPSGQTFVTITRSSTDTVVLTRNSTPCVGICTATAQAVDSAGNKATINLSVN